MCSVRRGGNFRSSLRRGRKWWSSFEGKEIVEYFLGWGGGEEIPAFILVYKDNILIL